MNTLEWLALAFAVSIGTSSILYFAISRPLGTFIGSLCPDGKSEQFWLRFTLVMLFLVPLFLVLGVRLPNPELNAISVGGPVIVNTGAVIQRLFRATLFGAFGSLLCAGFWISMLAR